MAGLSVRMVLAALRKRGQTAAKPKVPAKAEPKSDNAIQPPRSCSIIPRIPPTLATSSAPTAIRPAMAPADNNCIQAATTVIVIERGGFAPGLPGTTLAREDVCRRAPGSAVVPAPISVWIKAPRSAQADVHAI